MDPLLTKLLTKTNELRDTRHNLNTQCSSIINLCIECSLSSISTREGDPKIFEFDENNIPKSLLLLENLQMTLNGTQITLQPFIFISVC